MGRVFMWLLAIQVLLVVLALISCLSAEPGTVRRLPRAVWVLVILVFPLFGSIAYLAAGRPAQAAPRYRRGVPPSEPTRHRRPVAPDDDPDFLRSIAIPTQIPGEPTDRTKTEPARPAEENLLGLEDDPRKQSDTPPADS